MHDTSGLLMNNKTTSEDKSAPKLIEKSSLENESEDNYDQDEFDSKSKPTKSDLTTS